MYGFKYFKLNLDLIFFSIFIYLSHNLININSHLKSQAQTIGIEKVNGKTGGSVNSKDCGYIDTKPSHILNLMERMDYLRVSLKANGGDPTLLILGPGPQDRFCVLGDRNLGVNPELSGVWESGKYLIFVGNRSSAQHSFTLDISTEK